ncbi:hypothetical protein BC835DRAFT_1547400 [Cytidiella melzeri]|nr:hypothetical protein BC835DRAFT_1547400 [Cytidiella melzeri]
MKVATLASLAYFSAVASAQYFSEGWKPGQKATPTAAWTPEFTPGAQQAADGDATTQAAATAQGGFMEALAQGPVGALLGKAGINISASLAAAQTANELWDERIPLIHDDNFDELIVEESLTPEEELDRLWFLIISTTSGQQQQGGISKIVDREFDTAYNETVLANDLPNVRWGRVDYLNVTYLTTKWNVWRGPFLVVVKDRGQSLRFFHAAQSRLNSTIIRNFLKNEGWQQVEPWSSAFAPGGSREFVLHYFALGLRKLYDLIVPIPKFLLMIISGALGSLVMGLLHNSSKKKEEPKTKQKRTTAVAEKPAAPTPTTSSPASPKKGSGKAKKGSKK